LTVLRKQTESDPMIETLAGQVKRATKNDADTLAFYRTAVQNFPQHRALIYDYTDLLLQNHQTETALKLLAEQIIRHPSDTALYNLQAKTYSIQGKRLEQHHAQAYSYAWQGNLLAAIEQLEMAKQAGGSFYQLSVIETDLRELREIMSAHNKK
jgi:predicted Zn-dependent protease